jgi:methyl-accepting chemotaxis protein
MFSHFTLIKKFVLLGVVFFSVALLSVVVLISSVSRVEKGNVYLAEHGIPVLNAGHELKLSVVQVQQWLTDISATRGLDGLNDGFDEAETNAQRFRGLVAKLVDLDPGHRQEYEGLLPSFEAYYTVGQKMARAYVEQGPAGGNRMMAEFDEVAAALSGQVDALLKDITGRSDRLLVTQTDNLSSMQTMVFGALLVLVGLVSFIFFILYGALRLLPLVVAELNRVAEGDLTGNRRIARGRDEIGMLCEGLSTMKSQLKGLLSQVSGTSNELASQAEQMTAITEQSRASLDRQQVDIDQLATAMNEMSATSHEVAQNAHLTSGSAGEANDEAQVGRNVVQESIQGMRGLAADVNTAADVIRQLDEQGEQIGSILDVIRGIANQTNLLALNAAIEAARAGEQGRGFAVVADEVRTLASRTQQSTEEIQSMIEQLQLGTRNAVAVMNKGRERSEQSVEHVVHAGRSLDSITSAVERINDMNLQIATAAEEQSKVAEEMSHSITGISHVSEETSQGAQHTAAASRQLAELSVQLQTLVSHFKV